MGGLGSGWYRGGRAAVEDCRALDVHVLARLAQVRRAVRTGDVEWTSWSVSWTRDGALAFAARLSLCATPSGPGVSLEYEVGPTTATSTVSATVALGVSRSAFGGVRPWFLCPACGRRVRFLYLVREVFRCRACHDLTFDSRRSHRNAGGELALAVRRMKKIGERLRRARSPKRIARLRSMLGGVDRRAEELVSDHFSWLDR